MQYRCKVNISCDSGNYREGDLVEFFGEEAERLLKAGHIERERKPFEKAETIEIQVYGDIQ
jgi:hypothetical protein